MMMRGVLQVRRTEPRTPSHRVGRECNWSTEEDCQQVAELRGGRSQRRGEPIPRVMANEARELAAEVEVEVEVEIYPRYSVHFSGVRWKRLLTPLSLERRRRQR